MIKFVWQRHNSMLLKSEINLSHHLNISKFIRQIFFYKSLPKLQNIFQFAIYFFTSSCFWCRQLKSAYQREPISREFHGIFQLNVSVKLAKLLNEIKLKQQPNSQVRELAQR